MHCNDLIVETTRFCFHSALQELSAAASVDYAMFRRVNLAPGGIPNGS